MSNIFYGVSLETADNPTANGPSNTVKFTLLFSVLYVINLYVLWISNIKVRNFPARILVLAITILKYYTSYNYKYFFHSCQTTSHDLRIIPKDLFETLPLFFKRNLKSRVPFGIFFCGEKCLGASLPIIPWKWIGTAQVL